MYFKCVFTITKKKNNNTNKCAHNNDETSKQMNIPDE